MIFSSGSLCFFLTHSLTHSVCRPAFCVYIFIRFPVLFDVFNTGENYKYIYLVTGQEDRINITFECVPSETTGTTGTVVIILFHCVRCDLPRRSWSARYYNPDPGMYPTTIILYFILYTHIYIYVHSV